MSALEFSTLEEIDSDTTVCQTSELLSIYLTPIHEVTPTLCKQLYKRARDKWPTALIYFVHRLDSANNFHVNWTTLVTSGKKVNHILLVNGEHFDEAKQPCARLRIILYTLIHYVCAGGFLLSNLPLICSDRLLQNITLLKIPVTRYKPRSLKRPHEDNNQVQGSIIPGLDNLTESPFLYENMLSSPVRLSSTREIFKHPTLGVMPPLGYPTVATFVNNKNKMIEKTDIANGQYETLMPHHFCNYPISMLDSHVICLMIDDLLVHMKKRFDNNRLSLLALCPLYMGRPTDVDYENKLLELLLDIVVDQGFMG